MTDGAPQLDLSFRHHPVRGTWLERRRFRWPHTLARGFRTDAASGNMLLLVIQTVSGAILAQDNLAQHVHVGPNAGAHLVTQGATPVYRAPAGLSASDDIVLDIESGGRLDYQPELRILFAGASIEQRLTVRLPDSATALIADGFVLYDPDGTDRPFRRYASTLLLRRPDGAVLAADRIDLAAPPCSVGQRARYVAHGMLLLAAHGAPAWLEARSDDAAKALAGIDGVYAAASPLPNHAGVAVRLAAIDGRHLRLGLQAARAVLRPHLFSAART